MATFVLIHGGGSNAHYWHRVTPRLTAGGHEVIAPDLPTADSTADFEDYAAHVVQAVGQSSRVIVVGQSMGAFTAPLVARSLPTRLIVLLAPMIPAPGETPDQWGHNTGQRAAVERYAEQEGFDPTFDVMTTFMHDVPTDIASELLRAGTPPQAESIFDRPFPLAAWPQLPTRVIAGTLDRLFPLELVRQLAADRLGAPVDEIECGHLAALARPDAVADRLTAYAAADDTGTDSNLPSRGRS